MIQTEHRLLLEEEKLAALRVIDFVYPSPTIVSKVLFWVFYGVIGLLVFSFGFVNDNIFVLLSSILLSVGYFLFLHWFESRRIGNLNFAKDQVTKKIAGSLHYVQLVSNADFIEVQAYGIRLWLAQVDFSNIIRVRDFGSLSTSLVFPNSLFKVVYLQLDEEVDKLNKTNDPEEMLFEKNISFMITMGEPVLPLAVIGPQEYERIRHIVPTDGEPGHGRLTAMLDLLGYRPAPKANLPTQPGASA
jgi:hypothetical protein